MLENQIFCLIVANEFVNTLFTHKDESFEGETSTLEVRSFKDTFLKCHSMCFNFKLFSPLP